MNFTDHSLLRARERMPKYKNLSEHQLKQKITNLVDKSDDYFPNKDDQTQMFYLIDATNRLFALVSDDATVITIKYIRLEQELQQNYN